MEIITNITEKSPDRMTGFQWLNHYSETEENQANLSLDIGMRALISSKNCQHLSEEIFSDELTDSLIDNIFYMISSMGMQITVYNGQKKIFM